jgi:hypothetical protein
MRRVLFVFVALVITTCCIKAAVAEPFEDLIRKYVDEFTLATHEIDELSDKIEYGKRVIGLEPSDRYPYFKITEILTFNEVKAEGPPGKEIWVRTDGRVKADEVLLKPELDEFKISQENLLRMMESALPDYSKIGKNLKLGENFLNSEVFQKELKTFKDHSIFIVEIAKFEEISDVPDTPDELPHFGAWKMVQDSIAKLEIEKSLHAFEQRYGEKADKLNLVELALVNYIPPFMGNTNGPSPLEPILRITTINYNLENANFFPMFQIGLNYYFLEEGNWLLDWVHHVGLAAAAGDIQDNKFYRVEKISWGGIIHIGKHQVGIMREIRDQDWKVISSFDFQAVPGIF